MVPNTALGDMVASFFRFPHALVWQTTYSISYGGQIVSRHPNRIRSYNLHAPIAQVIVGATVLSFPRKVIAYDQAA
jgi:hypothetical protein